MGVKKSEKRIKKENFFQRVYDVFDKYTRALLVNCDNISAKQIHAARKDLRENDSLVLMGKNTLIRAALTKRMSEPQEHEEDYEERKKTWKPIERWASLLKLLKGNLGIIFTNQDLTDVKEIIDRHSRGAPAKVGSIAQCDVWIKAGSTGLDPKQTGFFQSLQIPTKIVKTQIEIVSDKQIIEEGQRVEGNEAALLEKLGITPFSYSLKVAHVIDNGSVFGSGVLDITTEKILESYKRALGFVTAISLEAGLPNKASAPHSIMRAFKNLVAVTMETDFTFAQAEAAKSAASNAPAAAAGGTGDAAPEQEEEKKEEEEEDFTGADIFGGGDDYDY